LKVVYNSFEGQYADSPRVIHRELLEEGGHEHVWLADPLHAATFPDDVDVVEYRSPECVAALEAADVLVANTHTDLEWDKRPDTLYLQTWHGTPLKRIHWDVMWAPEGRLERLSRDVARWDVMLSPNAASTPFLRQAFRYEGELLETGLPRNDLLLAADHDAVRARVRAELGIPDGVRAVLYTPTWRDDVVFSEGGREFSLHLDVDAFTEQLGEEHCLLLRLHYMLAGRVLEEQHPAVRDLSALPDVAELYLAADAMITDYSSTMFDFAITGKPMLFYAYDLEDYAGRLRGFYFDLFTEQPGPLVRSTPELIEAVRDLDATAEAYRERYDAFRARFTGLEDGRATERVLARIRQGA